MTELSEQQKTVARVLAAEDLYFFSRYMFQARRKQKWMRADHHKIICDALMRVYRGECKRLIINIPPRYSKTELAVINFVAWAMGNTPDAEFIHASYSATLAVKNSVETKSLMQHEEYAQIFPDTKLASDAGHHWKTTSGGVMYAAGSGGTITGFGAGKHREGFGGAIIIDDPHKADEATSVVIRDSVLDWFQNTLESRCNSPQTPIILIMQRLHENDLAGWLLNGGNGEEWEHICLPAIKANGEPLWKEKQDIEKLRMLQKSSPYVFAGQYMQNPTNINGLGFFAPEQLLHNGAPIDSVTNCDGVFATLDTAVKTGKSNDGTAVVFWAMDSYNQIPLVVMDWEYRQISGAVLEEVLPYIATRLEELSIQCGARSGNVGIFVEDKSSGQILIQQAARNGIDVVAIDSKMTAKGKTERGLAMSHYVNRDLVKFSKFAYEKTMQYKGRNKNHLFNSITSFKIGDNNNDDDPFDAFCYGVLIALERRT